MKKIIIVTSLIVIYILLERYGYLIQSWSNYQPPSIEDSTSTLIIDSSDENELNYLKLTQAKDIQFYAKNVPGARSLAKGGAGIIYVGTRKEGVIYALNDTDLDGKANQKYVVASGLNNPNGVVYHQGSLYVAGINRIMKFESIDSRYSQNPKYTVVYDQLPTDTHHGWRYMALGPDDKLYLGIGAPCNVCKVSDPYGSIARINLDGTGFEIIARGIRNTVGFDWNPRDNSLWFSENGRDLMGDDLPKDELNQLGQFGNHYGFPYCHEMNLSDPSFGKSFDCSPYQKPKILLSPHGAALGIKFLDDKVYIAEHGSWNRREPIGYRIMSVDIAGETASNYQVVVDGWLSSTGEAPGRPVDILVYDENSLLISDDFAGAIYRLSIK